MKLISNDLRDGDKLPHRHVFNGMGYDGDNISPHWRGTTFLREPKVLLSPVTIRMRQRVLAGGTG